MGQNGRADPRDGAVAKAPAAAVADIEQGRDFWSFRPLASSPPPEVHNAAWPRNEIDHFVLARLEATGLSPAPDADRQTIIRRAYFNLIGLPPTPAEVDEFVADQSPEAWSKVVDRLLAAPEFGQRWGRYWLDVARFAESSGGGRTLMFDDAWRYRDYVIESFNSDKPFNEFVMEHIAGDLMPGGSPQQRGQRTTATGFLVLGPTNYELQDKELLRMEVVDEQLDTMGRAFLGLTIGCARCHDHKFDPISNRDYYALAGILRSTKTLTPGNVAGFVTTDLPVDAEHRAALDAHAKVIREIESRLTPAQTELKRLQRRLAGVAPELDLRELPGIVVDNTQAKLIGQWKRSTSTRPFLGGDYIHDENTPDERKSATYAPRLPAAGEYEVRISYSAGTNRAARATVTIHHADGQQPIANRPTQTSADRRAVPFARQIPLPDRRRRSRDFQRKRRRTRDRRRCSVSSHRAPGHEGRPKR